ncbi:MAG: polysaccharide deacetylase family protein [Flavobacteriales bacterium]|nr:polysaccharide deacetylase family protein [Flavobacteriales bacterium]
MFFGAKTPKIVPLLFPSLVWSNSTIEKKVWLTFDDGPTPEVTPFVLDTLKKNNIKATFFCLGEQIEKHPNIFQRIKKEEHSIGNHSYSHPNGFTTCTKKYFNDIEKCQKIIPNTKLFRPPFGKIYPWQISKLKKLYKIIMWDVIGWDFKKPTSKEKCYFNIVNNVDKGSIILLHDNEKSYAKLQYALPKIIKTLKERGFTFSTIW